MKRWRSDGSARRCAIAAGRALLLPAIAVGASNAESPSAASSSFSPENLDRVGDYIRNEIATGKIPGAILLIQQDGKPVYFENVDVREVVTRLPMTADTI